MDQPAGAGITNPNAAESWLEPWLIKHSKLYRNHFTKGGRRESKSTVRNQSITEELESRNNSIAVPEVDGETTSAVPAPVEEPKHSIDAESSEGESSVKKGKGIHGLRRSVGWFPHP